MLTLFANGLEQIAGCEGLRRKGRGEGCGGVFNFVADGTREHSGWKRRSWAALARGHGVTVRPPWCFGLKFRWRVTRSRGWGAVAVPPPKAVSAKRFRGWG